MSFLDSIVCQDGGLEQDFDTKILDRSQEDLIEEPEFYKVLLHNDDFTPMDFVVEILQKFFNKVDEQANQIMLEVHNSGVGLGGIYPREIAETKMTLVHKYAHESDYPLKCTIEEE
jgi:ATP-dependent Clp protease adaptor protein ClpS